MLPRRKPPPLGYFAETPCAAMAWEDRGGRIVRYTRCSRNLSATLAGMLDIVGERATREEIRAAFLKIISRDAAKGAITFDVQAIASDVGRELRLNQPDPRQFEDRIVTEFLSIYADLFRQGAIAFGSYLDSRVHIRDFRLTDAGRALVADVETAPENRAGYLAGIPSFPDLSPVARSYLDEALAVFIGGHHRGAAVLLGAVAETVVLEMRDLYVAKLKEQKLDPSSSLTRETATAKEIYGVLSTSLRQHRMPRDLAESFEAHWDSFLADVRLSRNASGHPKTIAPVSRDEVRAGFLQLRSVLKLAAALRTWIANGMQKAENPEG